jgi:hypothetical protein
MQLDLQGEQLQGEQFQQHRLGLQLQQREKHVLHLLSACAYAHMLLVNK